MASSYESGDPTVYTPSTVIGRGMQHSLCPAYLSHLISHQGAKTIKGCSELYTLGNLELNSIHALLRENHIDGCNLLNAIPLVPDSACEQSSLSGTSTDCQPGIITSNQHTVMGFEPPAKYFQTWAENSPRAESASMAQEARDRERKP